MMMIMMMILITTVMMTMCLERIYVHRTAQIVKALLGDFFAKKTEKVTNIAEISDQIG